MAVVANCSSVVTTKKTWLIVKPQHHDATAEIFLGSGVKITAQGKRHLGSAIGSPSFIETYVQEKVTQWGEEVKHLATIAAAHPQAAHAAFTHGFSNKWTYLTRTIPDIANDLQPLEDAIRHFLLPAITGKTAIGDPVRELFTLPARLGGLNITNSISTGSSEYNASAKVTAPLVDFICQRTKLFDLELIDQQFRSKAEVRSERKAAQSAAVDNLYPRLLRTLQRLIDISKEKGVSVSLPVESHGFSIHKGVFRDDQARLDVKARGFGGPPQQSAYFDVKIFNPNAPFYIGTQLSACYRRHERQKGRAYEQCILEVEQGSFTPLIFSRSGGMGRGATVTYKRLASLISIKREQPYSIVMSWLRCRLSFSLLRSAIMS